MDTLAQKHGLLNEITLSEISAQRFDKRGFGLLCSVWTFGGWKMKQESQSKKDALAFIELYYSFVAYHQKVNGYKGALKTFIRDNMSPEDISGEVKLGAFSANQVRSREVYHLSVKYGMH